MGRVLVDLPHLTSTGKTVGAESPAGEGPARAQDRSRATSHWLPRARVPDTRASTIYSATTRDHRPALPRERPAVSERPLHIAGFRRGTQALSCRCECLPSLSRGSQQRPECVSRSCVAVMPERGPDEMSDRARLGPAPHRCSPVRLQRLGIFGEALSRVARWGIAGVGKHPPREPDRPTTVDRQGHRTSLVRGWPSTGAATCSEAWGSGRVHGNTNGSCPLGHQRALPGQSESGHVQGHCDES